MQVPNKMKLIHAIIYFLFFIQFNHQSFAILDPIDFFALQSIRKSLSDLPNSTFFATWDFSTDPCVTFSGILCDSDNKKVVSLNLGSAKAAAPGLTGRLPAAIGRLSALSELTLVPGRVYGSLPPSLSTLSALRFLSLSGNFISGPLPLSLSSLQRLRSLDLSRNRLSGPIPPSLSTLPELVNLVLSHNRLSGPIPVFSLMGVLNRVDLKNNNLSGQISTVHFPNSIEYLSLSSNKFEGPADGFLTRLQNLNYLDLGSNRFSGLIPVQVFSFPINTLNLNRNFFSGPVRPTGQVTISTVDLSYNRFYGEVSPMLSTVQNLYLNNNRFTGSVPGSVVEKLLASNIQTLYLQHNFLTGIEIDPRAEIPMSSSLCLQYNCMVPPVEAPCPLKAGTAKVRPTSQCIQWRG